jgi:TRAP-type C4-dicarboxylate transport system substrate-binding protein
MNAQSRITKFGSGLVAIVVLGMLAVLPAQAGSGLIKVTHSDTPYRVASQPVSSTAAKVQATVSQKAPGEIQVAVMANTTTQPGARHSVFIHR